MKINNNCKTFKINFYDNEYNIALGLGTYTYGGRLYVENICVGDIVECFSDLTVNIPTTSLEENEIILDCNYTDEVINSLVELGIIELTEKTTTSGFNTYKIARFNEEEAKDYIYSDYRESEEK